MHPRNALLAAALAALAGCTGQVTDVPAEAESSEIVLTRAGELRTGVLLAPGSPVIEYRDLGNGERIFEGDIALPASMIRPIDGDATETELGTNQQALFSDKPIGEWPGGTVPYVFAANVSTAVKTKVRDAMDLWEAGTGIRFVPRSGQTAHLVVRVGDSDYAEIGRNGGQQFCTIRAEALTGVIVHELGHTLGLRHEHTRPDRNQYVKVYRDRIRADHWGAYEIYQGGTKVGPYDMGSIMHYCRHTWANSSLPTMTRLDGSPIPHNWIKPTAKDYAAINQLYDETKPAVDFSAPKAEAVVSGTVAVVMAASDNKKVISVELFVDGKLVAADAAAPWAAAWDSSTVPNGFHTLSAKARDAAGNWATTSMQVLVAQGCNAP